MSAALDMAKKALAQGQFPVGAVLVAGQRVVATGGRINTSGRVNELDHAEIMALRDYYGGDLRDYDSDLTLYSTLEPCLMCYATLLVSGIHKIVYALEDPMGGGINLPLSELAPLYQQITPEIHQGVCRTEALSLFQKYYEDTANTYLRNTMLADFIMAA